MRPCSLALQRARELFLGRPEPTFEVTSDEVGEFDVNAPDDPPEGTRFPYAVVSTKWCALLRDELPSLEEAKRQGAGARGAAGVPAEDLSQAPKLRVVVALREDFFGSCVRFPLR